MDVIVPHADPVPEEEQKSMEPWPNEPTTIEALFGVLQRRVQDPWTSFWYNPLPCVSSQSEHWKDGLIASSWWCYVFSMFFISSHKLFMSIRASNTQEQVEERQTWKLFIATTSNLKPCVKIDLPDSLPSPLVQI